MAGAGFRTFAAGEVLTASNVNTYLMEQSIMNFAGTAARSSAISSPSEGMFAYLQDTNTLTFYNGSAWVNAGSAIAGTALSSGTASSGQVLTANGSGGVSFGNGGLTLINTTSFSAVSSQALPQDTFTSSYENYLIILNITAVTADAAIYMKLRKSGTDSSASYYNVAPAITTTNLATNFNQSNASTGWFINDVDSGANAHYYQTTMYLSAPKLSSLTTHTFNSVAVNSSTVIYGGAGGGVHTVTDTYDSINIIASAGNITGKVNCYGLNF